MTTDTADYSLVAEAAESHHDALVEADFLLLEIAAANRRPTEAELSFFFRNVRWDELKVRSELRRAANVLRFRAIAGSPDDRQAAEKEASTAASVLDSQGDKVRDQIEKLEAKLRGMENDARLSAKRVADQVDAVEQLRKLTPSHVADAVQRRRSAIDHSLGREIADSRIRRTEIECCLSPDRYPNEQSYLESLRRSCRPAVVEGSSGGYIRRSLSPEWPRIKAELQTELSDLTESMPEKQVEYDRLMTELESQLDHYAI